MPAKGHSQRLPRKNLRPLGGKPLLLWTLDAARASGVFGDNLWVSSDDDATLALAHEAGAQILKRPAVLASREATVLNVVDHARQALEHRGPVYVLLPTVPFRHPASIAACWRLYESRGCDALLSVVPLDHHPAWSWSLRHGALVPTCPELLEHPRHRLHPVYRHDGGHWILRGWPADTITPWSPPHRVEAIDINTSDDLDFAQYLLDTGRVPWIGSRSNAR